MEILQQFLAGMRPYLPLLVVAAIVAVTLTVAHRLLRRREDMGAHGALFHGQLVMSGLTFIGVLGLIMAMPISDTLRGQLLSLLGILLSAAIALSATTFLGNALAGILLRVVRSFRMGDFIEIDDRFGRASERGLFHTEIQTEDRDLVTLPNLHLVTRPVKVVRASGTIVSATVSLGYDVPHTEVAEVLKEAARKVELEDPFVRILELGDFSITYRVAGLLVEVKKILKVRSMLRASMLTELHAAGIEIVSPNFLNARVLAEGLKVIPETIAPATTAAAPTASEAAAFDKAEAAAQVESLAQRRRILKERAQELRQSLAAAESDAERERIKRRITEAEAASERLASVIEEKKEEQAP